MNITTGKNKKAVKIVLYGQEGIGKSTFAAQFPRPLFIDTEGSTEHMDVTRTDKPKSWTELLSQVNQFKDQYLNQFDTLVIDTGDWAEKLCKEHVASKAKASSIADVGNFGEGYTQNYAEFGRFLNLLQEIVDKGVHVVITAHSQANDFKSPDETQSYQRYELKLEKKTSPLLKEWPDMLLFAKYNQIVVTDSKTKQKTAVGGTERKLYTQRTAAWDGKNRFGLPLEMDFTYESIRPIIEANMRDSAAPSKQEPTPQPQQPQQEKKADPEPVAKPEQSIDDGMEEVPSAALKQLMQSNGVSVDELKYAVMLKGYYPADTDLRNYDPDFVNGVLIGAWEKVFEVIKEARTQKRIQI